MPPSRALAGIAFFSLLSSAAVAQTPPTPDVVHVPLQLSQDQRYVASVNMSSGDNSQHFGFAITTSTGYTLVANSSCASCAGNNVPTYNASQSTTAATIGAGQQQQTVALGGGILDAGAGTLSKENCALHQANGSFWQYPNQTIVQAGASPIFQQGVSGLVGLGANAPFGDTVLGGWLSRNPAQHNVSFGLALAPPPAVTSQNTAPVTDAGTLHMLQPDAGSYTGAVQWHPAQSWTAADSGDNGADAALNTSSWVIALDGWTVQAGGAEARNMQGGAAAVEPFFASIFMPAAQVNQLYASVPGAQLLPAPTAAAAAAAAALGQVYTIPCTANFTFSVILAGQTYTIGSDALVLQDTDGTCVGAIEGWADPSTAGFLLGSRFISTVYMIFQTTRPPAAQQQIGIAARLTAAGAAKPDAGAIAGGVVGGVAAVLLLAALAVWIARRRGGGGGSGVSVRGDAEKFSHASVPAMLRSIPGGGEAYAPVSRHDSLFPLLQSPPPTAGVFRDQQQSEYDYQPHRRYSLSQSEYHPDPPHRHSQGFSEYQHQPQTALSEYPDTAYTSEYHPSHAHTSEYHPHTNSEYPSHAHTSEYHPHPHLPSPGPPIPQVQQWVRGMRPTSGGAHARSSVPTHYDYGNQGEPGGRVSPLLRGGREHEDEREDERAREREHEYEYEDERAREHEYEDEREHEYEDEDEDERERGGERERERAALW